MTRTSIVSALLACALLSACGGGQDQSQEQEPRADTAAADTTTAPPPAEPPAVSPEDNAAWARSAALSQADVEQGLESGKRAETLSFIAPKAVTAPAAPIYRFFNTQTGAHLLTRSIAERDTTLNTMPQFRYEGPVFSAWQTTDTGLAPVYRFFNNRTGTHMFTISESERNNIVATMPWMTLEGTAYYAARTALPGTTALYRFYHLQRGFHFYTASAGERDHLIANLAGTYQYDGVGYFVNASVGSYNRALAPLAGKVNTYGNVNGLGESARFGLLRGMAFDPTGNLYAVDVEQCYGMMCNPEIRKVSPNGVVTSFAGSWLSQYSYSNGIGSGIAFYDLRALTIDSTGNVYIGDGRTVRSISTSAESRTIAGSLSEPGYLNGQAQSARFRGIQGIARDSLGNLYVADTDNHAIRKISTTGVVTTFAGADPTAQYKTGNADGVGTNARFNGPKQITIDSSNNLYVADFGNHLIRKISPSGVVTTLAGQSNKGVVDGVGTSARFDGPFSITIDRLTENLYVSDWGGCVVRKITPAGEVTTVVGMPYNCGVFFGALPAGLSQVGGLAVRNGRLYIASLNGIYWTNLP